MRKVMFWSPCIYFYFIFIFLLYLFIYLYACYSHNKKSFKPNCMKFGGTIGYYLGAIWLDFGIDRVKAQGQGHEKVKILNRMTFGGMIAYYLGAIWFDFGINRVKGQGHGKVKIFFLP